MLLKNLFCSLKKERCEILASKIVGTQLDMLLDVHSPRTRFTRLGQLRTEINDICLQIFPVEDSEHRKGEKFHEILNSSVQESLELMLYGCMAKSCCICSIFRQSLLLLRCENQP